MSEGTARSNASDNNSSFARFIRRWFAGNTNLGTSSATCHKFRAILMGMRLVSLKIDRIGVGGDAFEIAVPIAIGIGLVISDWLIRICDNEPALKFFQH